MHVVRVAIFSISGVFTPQQVELFTFVLRGGFKGFQYLVYVKDVH